MLTLKIADQAEASGRVKPLARWSGSLFSALVHGAVVLVLLGVFHRTAQLQHYKLPGTSAGVRFLPYYRPGSPKQASSDLVEKTAPAVAAVTTMHSPAAPPQPARAKAAAAENGSGASAQSGLGEGDVTIALQTFFPYPKPDLSGLAHGTKGDVILNAVIDEHGKITELTLLQGLGQPIDDVVMATVRQWSYTPAKKNGIPIPCEQELHFHYERG